MYDELVKALRGCVLSKPCDGCPYYDPNGPTEKCATMNIAAADAIETLYAAYIESFSVIAKAFRNNPKDSVLREYMMKNVCCCEAELSKEE